MSQALHNGVPTVFRPNVLSPNGASKAPSNFYTPDAIIQVARYLMGGIDLDPCSDAIGQQRINATQFMTHGGLNRVWFDRVFVNPPGRSTAHTIDGRKQTVLADAWWQHLVNQHDIGNVTSGFYVSFSIDRLQTTQHCTDSLLDHPTFIPNKRIAYLNADGSVAKSPPKPSCFTWVNEFASCSMLESAFRDVGIEGIAVRR